MANINTKPSNIDIPVLNKEDYKLPVIKDDGEATETYEGGNVTLKQIALMPEKSNEYTLSMDIEKTDVIVPVVAQFEGGSEERFIKLSELEKLPSTSPEIEIDDDTDLDTISVPAIKSDGTTGKVLLSTFDNLGGKPLLLLMADKPYLSVDDEGAVTDDKITLSVIAQKIPENTDIVWTAPEGISIPNNTLEYELKSKIEQQTPVGAIDETVAPATVYKTNTPPEDIGIEENDILFIPQDLLGTGIPETIQDYHGTVKDFIDNLNEGASGEYPSFQNEDVLFAGISMLMQEIDPDNHLQNRKRSSYIRLKIQNLSQFAQDIFSLVYIVRAADETYETVVSAVKWNKISSDTISLFVKDSNIYYYVFTYLLTQYDSALVGQPIMNCTDVQVFYLDDLISDLSDAGYTTEQEIWTLLDSSTINESGNLEIFVEGGYETVLVPNPALDNTPLNFKVTAGELSSSISIDKAVKELPPIEDVKFLTLSASSNIYSSASDTITLKVTKQGIADTVVWSDNTIEDGTLEYTIPASKLTGDNLTYTVTVGTYSATTTISCLKNVTQVTATVDANSGTPSVDVSFTGNIEKTLSLAFHNLKGPQGETGPKGDTGDTGPQGPQGETGADGADGTDGQDGVSPTLSIGTVTTGEAGSNASASITEGDTANSYKLNLTIPRGDAGQDAEIDPLTASRALVSDSSGKVAVSDVTATELSYLDGSVSNIQSQINKAMMNLFAIRALTTEEIDEVIA